MADASGSSHEARVLGALIIGAGFSGIGMGVALRREGIEDFTILERAQDVGGVWRDNRYPGAACDVPSHLYSFSFEPNPGWSRVFSQQTEIVGYLRHCARRYDLLRHLRFGAEVQSAHYDEQGQLWRVQLRSGEELRSRILISGVGQLSRPALPNIPGLQDFAGRSFHSADWDPQYALEGQRVAVIGTGASAIQFIPAIAPRVGLLKVFQRSPAWMMKRADRAYTGIEKRLFAAVPLLARLHRLQIYLRYEMRALAFTRFSSLMKIAVEWPFQRMLKQQVHDPELRARLVPDYPIGCKRILLSDDYLGTMNRANVELVTDGIRRVTAQGIETIDGRVHEVDAIVYGTGFAATEFLAPMSITGRDGIDLNRAWKNGAMAYLGLTVPGFPNFFMLYGPNTNLGHNSIVYMLESQIAHVMRCLRHMKTLRVNTIEVRGNRYTRYNAQVQRRLGGTVWNGCKSWYVDANGHNSTNWPGFTYSYRWMAHHASLSAYHCSNVDADATGYRHVTIAEPRELLERASAQLMRLVLRFGFRPFIGPPFPVFFQRRVVDVFALLMPARFGAHVQRERIAGRRVDIVRAPRSSSSADTSSAAILYLHGGAFCLGGPRTHRSISSRLALDSGLPVWLPDYRLAPEHPYPAAVDDALACLHEMNRRGYATDRIVIAGDSAGGALALDLALRLREQGQTAAGLALISPVTDPLLRGDSLRTLAQDDPMIRNGWLQQGLGWYGKPSSHSVLDADLRGLPPILIQVGEQEILLSDSTRLAEHAASQGVAVTLERHEARWHVFHLQSFFLRSGDAALATMADFCRHRALADEAVPHRAPPGATALQANS